MTDRDVEDENTLTEGQTLSQASVKCLWDEGHLYCLAEVKDDKISVESFDGWDQDSVEFFVDENMSKADYYDDDDAQYRTTAEGEESFGDLIAGIFGEQRFDGLSGTKRGSRVISLTTPNARAHILAGQVFNLPTTIAAG